LRLSECLSLRVKDIDFEYRQITVRDGKGEKDRVTVLPRPLQPVVGQRCRSIRFGARDSAAAALCGS